MSAMIKRGFKVEQRLALASFDTRKSLEPFLDAQLADLKEAIIATQQIDPQDWLVEIVVTFTGYDNTVRIERPRG